MSYRELPQVKGVDFDIYTQISKRPRSFLDLQVGDRCNFKCVYCFTGAGEEVRGLAEQYRHRTSKIANLLTAAGASRRPGARRRFWFRLDHRALG